MLVSNKSFNNIGFLQVKLDPIIIDYLWKITELGKERKNDYKHKLIGNISNSYKLEDSDDFFYKNICIPLVKRFRKDNGGLDPFRINTQMLPETPLLLNEFWVNYQYETEFNPYHDHRGVYSFNIWMKIPYDWEEQTKLAKFDGIEKVNKRAGCFEFEYIDTLGLIRNHVFQLRPEFEGSMVFFPSNLRHAVYPFYGSKEARVSIAGNLIFDTTQQ